MKRIFTFSLAILTCISLCSQGLALELLGHTSSGIEGELERAYISTCPVGGGVHEMLSAGTGHIYGIDSKTGKTITLLGYKFAYQCSKCYLALVTENSAVQFPSTVSWGRYYIKTSDEFIAGLGGIRLYTSLNRVEDLPIITSKSDPFLKGFNCGGGIIVGRISPHKGWRT